MLNTCQPAVGHGLIYSYDEFADHIKAMKTVRKWEYTSRFGHVGDAQTSRANNARVLEYFSDCYEDQSEAVHKAELFLSIYDYIARNASTFARKHLLEKEGGTFSVDSALLRAVHHIFTLSTKPSDVPIRPVVNLAKAFKRISEAV
jgi:hypothetical protein